MLIMNEKLKDCRIIALIKTNVEDQFLGSKIASG
jgi:hypothetical protein